MPNQSKRTAGTWRTCCQSPIIFPCNYLQRCFQGAWFIYIYGLYIIENIYGLYIYYQHVNIIIENPLPVMMRELKLKLLIRVCTTSNFNYIIACPKMSLALFECEGPPGGRGGHVQQQKK